MFYIIGQLFVAWIVFATFCLLAEIGIGAFSSHEDDFTF